MAPGSTSTASGWAMLYLFWGASSPATPPPTRTFRPPCRPFRGPKGLRRSWPRQVSRACGTGASASGPWPSTAARYRRRWRRYFADVDGHGPEAEAPVPHARETCRGHDRRKPFGPRKGLHGGRKVRVGGGVAGDDAPQKRYNMAHPDAVEVLPGAIRSLGRLEAH